MGCWRQIGEKAPNKLEQYRRSCIHTEALLEIFMVNKSTLYSDVMAPNMLARPPRGKYGADEEKIILFPVATTSHREAATTNNGCHHQQDHHLHHNHHHHHLYVQMLETSCD